MGSQTDVETAFEAGIREGLKRALSAVEKVSTQSCIDPGQEHCLIFVDKSVDRVLRECKDAIAEVSRRV